MEDTLGLPRHRPAVVLAAEEADPPHMVTFEQPGGDSESLPYTDLLSIRFHAPDDGLNLRFADSTVLVRGSNLLQVWRAFRSRCVLLLRVGGIDGPNEPRIDSITITDVPRRKR